MIAIIFRNSYRDIHHGCISQWRSFLLRNTTLKIDLVNYEAPFITETGGHISKKYPHKYCDNGLCLGITTEILMKCCTNNIFLIYLSGLKTL